MVLCVAAALITALGLIFMTVCAQSDIIPDAIAAKRRPGHMMIDLEKNLVSTRFALAARARQHGLSFQVRGRNSRIYSAQAIEYELPEPGE